jgi:hypothetical protein
MFAAEDLIKNAMKALSLMQRRTSGYGFVLIDKNTRIGFRTSDTRSMVPTRSSSSFPESTKMERPLYETV